MASQGVVIVRTAGHLIPDKYLELVLKNNPSCMGYAFGAEDKVIQERYTFDKDNPPPTIGEFKEMQKADEDMSVAYFFGAGATADNSDLQPYEVLVNDKGEPTLMLVMDGDFSSYTQSQSTLSDAYHALSKSLIPFIRREFSNVGQKLPELVNSLHDDLQKQFITNTISTTGVITLIVQGMKPMSFEKGQIGSTFPWGWVSNTYGYTEKAPAQTVVQKVTSRFGRGKPVTDAPVADTAVAAVTDPPAMPKPVPDPTKDTPIPVETEHEMITPPASLIGRALQTWYGTNCQFIPKNFWERPAAPKKNSTIKSFKDMPKPVPDPNIKVTHEVVPDPKKVEDETIVLTPEDIKVIQTHIATLDRTNKVQDLDIKQLQAAESKKPTLFEAIGEADDTIYDYRDEEFLLALGKASNKALALLCRHYRYKFLEAQHLLDVQTEPAVTSAPQPVAAEKRRFGR